MVLISLVFKLIVGKPVIRITGKKTLVEGTLSKTTSPMYSVRKLFQFDLEDKIMSKLITFKWDNYQLNNGCDESQFRVCDW